MAKERIFRRRGVNSGFTVAEAVVVIVVVAFLLSILVPALARVKTAAREEVECRANLRQVGIVIGMFLQENDFVMPDCHVITWGNGSNRQLWTTDGRESSPRLGPDDDSYWGTAYNKYVKDINIFRCPAMAQFLQTLDTPLSSYGLHPSVDPNDVIEQASFGLNGYTDQLNTNSVPNHGKVVICTDHVEPRNEQAHDSNRGDMFCRGMDQTNLTHYRIWPFRDPDAASYPGSRSEFYRGIFRHNVRSGRNFQTGGRASVLWLDGRVSAIEETYGDNVPNRWYDPRGMWLDIVEKNYIDPDPVDPPPR